MNCESCNNAWTFLLPIPRAVACGVFVSLIVVWGAAARGQEDPLEGAAAPDKPPAEGTAEVSEYDKLLAAETDPLVLAILDAKPTTPDQWIHDVRALLNLERIAFAKQYLKQFLALSPSQDEMAQIHQRYGSALFLRLSTTAELQPEGAAVADAVTQAAVDWLQNAARLKALVERLSDQDPATRRLALADLVQAGTPAAVPLIAVLGDSGRSDEHAAVRAALVALGKEAVDPLLAALNSTNAALVTEAMAVLGDIKSLQAVPLVLPAALAPDQDPALAEAARKMLRKVLSDVPSREEAIRFLSQRLDNFLAGSTPGPADQDDQVTVWIWDNAQQAPRQQTFAAADASFLAAAVVAEQLYRIDASNTDFQVAYLATGLEVAKRLNGYNRPLTKELGAIYRDATAADADVLEAVLERALDQKMQGAAIAAIDLLGQTKNNELLRSSDGRPGLLARSMISPLPRVKFAAAQAVMTINPKQPYPGSSYLPEVLGYLSSSGGARRVLIGNPRAEDAQQLASYFRVLGFTVDSQPTGRKLALQAVTNPDYSFVLLYDTIDRPRYRELIQILRRDPRTADLPVGLVSRDVHEEAATAFAQTDPLTLSLAPPQTQDDVATDTRRLLAAAGRGQVTQDERIHQALFALDALAQLAGEPEQYKFYDLLSLDQRMEHALTTPRLAGKAASVLGLLGTPRAQRALVEFANTQTQPLADRQAAAAAFHTAVSRRGLLLTRDRILLQYDKYNRSEFLDQETQQILAEILDAIEAPSRASQSANDDD